MATGGQALFGKPKAAGDNLLFHRLRWVLLLWMAADVGLYWSDKAASHAWSLALLGAFVVSQMALWRLPAHFLKGPRLYTVMFLLDLFFGVGTLLVMGQAASDLLVAVFLTVFIAALVQRLSLAALISLVSTLIYIGWRFQDTAGHLFDDPRDLLGVPFIMLSSLHACITVSEAQFHQDIEEALDADNKSLNKKLGTTASELRNRVRFINASLDAIPAPTFIVDGDGLLRSFNTRAEELFQAKRALILDKPLKEIAFLEPLRQALRTAGTGDAYVGAWLKSAKGGEFYATVRSGAARDEDGRLLNLAVFVQPAEAPPEAAASEEPAPAVTVAVSGEVPLHPAPGASAQPETLKPAGSTSSGIIQRSIAATVEQESDDASKL